MFASLGIEVESLLFFRSGSGFESHTMSPKSVGRNLLLLSLVDLALGKAPRIESHAAFAQFFHKRGYNLL